MKKYISMLILILLFRFVKLFLMYSGSNIFLFYGYKVVLFKRIVFFMEKEVVISNIDVEKYKDLVMTRVQ